MISITPNTSYLESIASMNLSWHDALCELIDNSLDAGARHVRVLLSGASLFVRDDGGGCGPEDIVAFARFGEHIKTANTKSGRYGVGAKQACIWVGGSSSQFTVNSVCGDQQVDLIVDWASVRENGWQIDSPEVSKAAKGMVGTTVRVAPVVKRVPTGVRAKRLLESLSFTYSPATENGVRLTVRVGRDEMTLKRFAEPKMLHVVDEQVCVAGKHARVRAGVVEADTFNPKPGITYRHGFRVIIPSSVFGCGDYSSSRVYGTVDIDDGWTRGTNKNEIVDGDDLFEAVFEVIEPVLMQAAGAESRFASTAFETQLKTALNNAMGVHVHPRGRGNGGTGKGVKPTGTGTPHSPPDSGKESSRRGRRKASGVNVQFVAFDDTELVGDKHGNDVRLNISNPGVAAARAEGVRPTAIIAMGIIAAHASVGDDQLRLPMDIGDGANPFERYQRALGALMANEATFDGEPVAGAAE